MNTDNFIIESSDIELAQSICKMIDDGNIRNRAVANAIAANIAARFFDKENYNVDSESGLHNIGKVLEDIDISDIYINKNYIDVRVFFSEEELSVPEAHFKNNLLPIAYMFVKVNEDLSGAGVIGFIAPENINQNNAVNGNYYIDENDLKSFYDIEMLLVTPDEEIEVSDKDIFAYLDNTLNDKNQFYSELLQSKEAREKLLKAAKAKEIFQFVSVVKDNTASEITSESTEQEFLPSFDEELILSDDDMSLDLVEDVELEESGEDGLLAAGEAEELDFKPMEEVLEIQEEEPSEDIISLEESEQETLSEDELQDVSFETELEAAEPSDFGVIELEEITHEENTEVSALSFVEDTPSELKIAEEQPEEELVITDIEDEQDNTESDEILEEAFIQEEAEETEDAQQETFDFSTVTSPSNDTDDILDELSNAPDSSQDVEDSNNNEQIEALFNGDETAADENEDELTQDIEMYKNGNKSKGSMKPVVLIAFLILIGALGYFGYSKYFGNTQSNELPNTDMPIDALPVTGEQAKVEDAMPIETVESNTVQNSQNEGVSESIPAIEQNLDASILVSNLKVDWEVPSGYASNTSAKRYLVKLGKIIQLNLKTELLLLNKPPISNKISVEIKYNSGSRKFEAVGVVVSSGEKSVDDLILQTVNRALGMNLSTNTDSFAKLQGNPVLVIHL